MNRQEAAILLSYVVAAMPNVQKLDLTPTANLWAAVMPDVSFNLAQQALLKILREKNIPTVPLPGEVLDAIRDIVSTNGKNKTPSAYEAWEEVRNKLDFYKPKIEWSNPLIAKAVKIIGSRNICGVSYDVSEKFFRVYNQLVQRKKAQYENAVTLQITQNADGNLISFINEHKQIKNVKGGYLNAK